MTEPRGTFMHVSRSLHVPAEIDPTAEETREIHRQLYDWLNGYIGKPHPELGRNGPVCPFVPPAIRERAVAIAVRFVGREPTVDSVTGVLRAAVADFSRISWRHSNAMLNSLVVVLPDLAETEWALLDEAHALIKSEVVRRGLMIGQFHPACTEPAARNGSFMISRSPLALAVIRNMALHDILFLDDRSDWFAEYASRFGHRYRTTTGIDQAFALAFARASERFA